MVVVTIVNVVTNLKLNHNDFLKLNKYFLVPKSNFFASLMKKQRNKASVPKYNRGDPCRKLTTLTSYFLLQTVIQKAKGTSYAGVAGWDEENMTESFADGSHLGS